jgi:hypothetical protein
MIKILKMIVVEKEFQTFQRAGRLIRLKEVASQVAQILDLVPLGM